MESQTFSVFRLTTIISRIRLVTIGRTVRSRLNRESERYAKNMHRDAREKKEKGRWL